MEEEVEAKKVEQVEERGRWRMTEVEEMGKWR